VICRDALVAARPEASIAAWLTAGAGSGGGKVLDRLVLALGGHEATGRWLGGTRTPMETPSFTQTFLIICSS
jgi:hypothetical protein